MLNHVLTTCKKPTSKLNSFLSWNWLTIYNHFEHTKDMSDQLKGKSKFVASMDVP